MCSICRRACAPRFPRVVVVVVVVVVVFSSRPQGLLGFENGDGSGTRLVFSSFVTML